MSTEKKIYLAVIAVSILIMAGSFFTPNEERRTDDFPWHIEHPKADAVRVFGLTLGESDTNLAERRFKEEAKPSLFKTPEGKLVAEVFFEQVRLGGLPSKIVLTIAVPEAELQGMYDRGLRMAATGDGKKITMTPDDIAKMRTYPIGGLTYLPGLRVEEPILLKRFGEPAQRITEADGKVTHWLYPGNGLDIAMSAGEKPVLQYVQPKEFERLSAPVLKAAAGSK